MVQRPCQPRLVAVPAVVRDIAAGDTGSAHFAGRRVIVEVDSWRHHSGQVAFARDRRKWEDLRADGYEVVVVTASELEH